MIDLFEEQDVLANVNRVGAYLEKRLNELAAEFSCVETRRGAGLMQGLVFGCSVGDIITEAMERGLVLINAGTNIIRFVPSLVITEENVDDMITILRESILHIKGERN